MTPQRRAVLVTGANGFIGNAVCRSFVRAGWVVYGLVRRPEAMPDLALEEIIPVLGSPADRSFLPALLEKQKSFDAIVSTTEQFPKYESHFLDVMSLIRDAADASNAAGVRPIVLFSSGCKDYGMTNLADSPTLAVHTEDSPLNPPSFLKPRTINAAKIFGHGDSFDGVVMRPTTVYGRSGSFYSLFFDMAREAKQKNQPLKFPASPKTVLHGTHVDDCGDAYLAVAECQDRKTVAGQCFNVSGWRYETLEEIGEALVKEYGLEKGVVYEPPPASSIVAFDPVIMLTGFSQWVGSDRIRTELGWRDRRRLFSENLGSYRVACEEAGKRGHSSTDKIKQNKTLSSLAKPVMQITYPFRVLYNRM